MYDTELMLRIAKMYYENDMNQDEISKKVYVSRSMVSRMIKQAKELGIVEITIRPLYEEHCSLENKLKGYFPNCEFHIVYSDNSDTEEEFDVVCNMSASCLKNHLDEKTVLAISRGKTVANTIEKLKPEKNYPEMQIVQLCGSIAGASNSSTDEMSNIQQVGKLFGCKINRFFSPYIFDDKNTKNMICKSKEISSTLNMAKDVNTFISTVDTVLYWKDHLEEKEISYLIKQKAVGCIWGWFFDIDGNILDTPLYERMVIPSATIFNTVCTRICVANDRFKTNAVLGALRGGLCNHLITNSKIASRLIEKCEK